MALETSLDAPAPVRQISLLLDDWISRLGAVWVEGQLAQINRRSGVSTVFMTLRDPIADVSISLTCARSIFDSLPSPPVEGARVVVQAKPSFYPSRGTLSLQARAIHLVGLGDLLAQLERRRQLLAAEGLFAGELKRPLPFLPRAVGLVTAPRSAAERDVVENARRRWPALPFVTAYAAMQGTRCVPEVVAGLQKLDRNPEVDVIVVARGGGSVEDLLPFSDESLVRCVHGLRTPVVSAIGHDQDQPLLDLVADVRASTPTDAAKLICPDLAEEQALVAAARGRLRHVIAQRISAEQHALAGLRSRPVLATPDRELAAQRQSVTALRERGQRATQTLVTRSADDLIHRRARLRGLSPLATLERGYAVVQGDDGQLVTQVQAAQPGQRLSVRVTDGRFSVVVDRPASKRPPKTPKKASD